MRMRGVCVPLVAALAASGCSTVATKSAGGWGTPYSGARCSYRNLNDIRPSGPGDLPVVALIAADVPLSILADTALLPVDWALSAERTTPGCTWFR